MDGLPFTEGQIKAVWSGCGQVERISTRLDSLPKKMWWKKDVKETRGGLKSIKWICGEGMSWGAEWGGHGTKDRWCLNTLNAERAGGRVKKSTRAVLVSSFCHGTCPCQVEYGSTMWYQCRQVTPSEQHE